MGCPVNSHILTRNTSRLNSAISLYARNRAIHTSPVRFKPILEPRLEGNDQVIHDMESGNIPSDAVIDPDLLAISAPHGESMQMHSTSETGARIPQISRGFEECDLSQLSPRSRRRYKKRMYMRRKRAEASGNVMSQSFTKLKPKRKGAVKKMRSLTEAKELDIVSPSPLADAQLETSQLLTLDFRDMEDKEEYFDLHAGKAEFEVSLAEGFPRHNEESGSDPHATSRNDTSISQSHVSGLTHPYKVKDTILSYGFDAANCSCEPSISQTHLMRETCIASSHIAISRNVVDAAIDQCRRICAMLMT